MPSARFQPSFASGVLGPGLWGRIDLAKYDSALRKAVNCFVHAHGGISNRPGLRFVCEVMDSDHRHRLIPFVREADDASVLIFGQNRMGVVKRGKSVQTGGTDYTIYAPWTAAQAQVLDTVQSIDVMFMAHSGVQPTRLSRIADDNWTFANIPINPTVPVPVISAVTPRRAGEETYSYRVSAVVNGTEGFASNAVWTNFAELLAKEGAYNTVTFSAVPDATEYRVYRMRNDVPGYIGFTATTTFREALLHKSA